jgi:hypothetical protein
LKQVAIYVFLKYTKRQLIELVKLLKIYLNYGNLKIIIKTYKMTLEIDSFRVI